MTQSTDTSSDVMQHLSSITFNAITQIQAIFETSGLKQAELAEKLGITEGRVSQILNADTGMTLKQMVRLVRTMGLKACVLFYNDGDARDKYGPLHPSIFESCWKECGEPKSMQHVSVGVLTDKPLPANVIRFERTATTKDTNDARTIPLGIYISGSNYGANQVARNT